MKQNQRIFLIYKGELGVPIVCIHRTISYYWSDMSLACTRHIFVCPEMLLLKNSDQLSDYRKSNFYNRNAVTIYSLNATETAYGCAKKDTYKISA